MSSKQRAGPGSDSQNQRHSHGCPHRRAGTYTHAQRNTQAGSAHSHSGCTPAAHSHLLGHTRHNVPRDTRCTTASPPARSRRQLSTHITRGCTNPGLRSTGTGISTKPRRLARHTLFSSSWKTGGTTVLSSSFHLVLFKPWAQCLLGLTLDDCYHPRSLHRPSPGSLCAISSLSAQDLPTTPSHSEASQRRLPWP